MMTLNYNEKDFQKKLQKDIEMPEIVHEHINQAYRLIENNAVLQKKASKDPYHWMKSGGRIAGGMAAVLAVGFVFCAINPVMAKNIPVVGGLFEILQDNVSFFGDFSYYATTLEAVDGTKTDSSETDGAKTDHANNDAIYTKTADGLTITCSEVYANSQAIYVTMQFKSDKPFPETETGAESGTPVIDLDMTGGVDFNSEASPVIDGQVEGKFLDDNTYACIFRYDLAEAAKDYTEYNEKYNEMTQQVMDEMGITQADLDDQTDEGYALLEEFINKVSERGGEYQKYIKDFEIACDDKNQPVRMLSGGNIQKVVVAREFTSGSNFILANQPTRGIDVGAAEMIRKTIVKKSREEGTATLLISADLNEVLECSDRLIVMRKGKIVASFPKANEVSESELGE